MRLNKKLYFIVFMLLFQFGYGQNDSIQNRLGVTTNISIFLEDLYDVGIKNNFFRAKLYYELSAPKDHDIFLLDDFNNAQDLSKLQVEIFEGVPIDVSDSIKSMSYHSIKGRFDHKWNVRNYPFDKPSLKLVFKATADTSLVSLIPGTIGNYDKMENLKDGFELESISHYKEPITSKETSSLNVLDRLVFEINLVRSGSWLYLKLFLGSFLAFVISWLVFFIPKEEFGSRIDLSVGAIFGAVGNRAYVETIMPDVQVLTKADMINNAIIFLIIFNIIIFMIQRNKKIELKFFEDNFNSSVYTAYIFIVIMIAIRLW